MNTDFGPLNGVRAALVIAAVVAGVVAAALGHWIVALVLGAAVVVHGLGWMYLARHPHKQITDR